MNRPLAHDEPALDAASARIEDIPRYALAVGIVLVLLVPAARGFNETLGWLPLWLLAMPCAALWTLRASGRMATRDAVGEKRLQRRRRKGPQARHYARGASGRILARAA